MAYRAHTADDTVPMAIPVRCEASKEKIQITPANVMNDSPSSTHDMRLLNSMGSNRAVKNPISEKQTTPIDTFDALMEP